MSTKTVQTQHTMYAGLKITSCGQPELITAEGPLGMSIKTCIKA